MCRTHTHKVIVDLIVNLANYLTKKQYNAVLFYIGKLQSYMAIHTSNARLLYILLHSVFFILDQSAAIKIGHHRNFLDQVSCCLFFSIFSIFSDFFFLIMVWPSKQDAVSVYNL